MTNVTFDPEAYFDLVIEHVCSVPEGRIGELFCERCGARVHKGVDLVTREDWVEMGFEGVIAQCFSSEVNESFFVPWRPPWRPSSCFRVPCFKAGSN